MAPKLRVTSIVQALVLGWPWRLGLDGWPPHESYIAWGLLLCSEMEKVQRCREAE